MNRLSIYFCIFLFAFILLHIYSVQVRAYSENQPYASGHIIIKFRSDIMAPLNSLDPFVISQPEKLIKKITTTDHVGLGRIYTVSVPKGLEVQAVQELQKNPAVEYAELDYLAQSTSVPNDPYYLVDNMGQRLWYRDYLSMEPAWSITTGSSSVVIATVDTGIDYLHPDLQDKIWTNTGEITGNNIDDDGNGYIDDVHGWNFGENPQSNDTNDDYGHGTSVAGIAGASTNNGIGIAGMNWNSPILPVKANVPGTLIMNYSALAAAVTYADSFANVRVINISAGGNSDSQLLRDAINNVQSNNKTVIVAGAGNDGRNILFQPFYPASYRGVVAVTAYTNNQQPYYNYGYPVAIAAPGTMIYTTFLDTHGYAYNGGTSFSTPFVSGEAALVTSLYPSWDAREIRQAITFWAQCPPDSNDCDENHWTAHYGYGPINGLNPLLDRCPMDSSPVKTSLLFTQPLDRTNIQSQQTITLRGIIKSNNMDHYTITYGKSSEPPSWSNDGVTITTTMQPGVEGPIASWDLSHLLYSDYYQIRLRTIGTTSCRNNITGEERAVIFVTRRYKVSGKVKNTSGQPEIQVPIHIIKNGSLFATIYSDANGLFSTYPLDQGNYTIRPVPRCGEIFTPSDQSVLFSEGVPDLTNAAFIRGSCTK